MRTLPFRAAATMVLVILAANALGAAPAAPGGQGVELDGKTAYCAGGKAVGAAPAALTVSAWVRVRDPAASQVFVNRGLAGGCFTFYLYKDNVRMLVAHKEGEYAYALAPPPVKDTWTHYAGTYDGKVIRVYCAGRLAAATPASGRIVGGDGMDLFLGSLDAHERFLRGRLADVRLWRRALTAEEVAAVAAGKAGGELDRGLMGRWTADGLAGTTWRAAAPAELVARQITRTPAPAQPAGARYEAMAATMKTLNTKDDGFRGIWYSNQPSGDEYVYKYSGGLGTYCAKHIPHAWYAREVDKTFFTYGGRPKNTNVLLHEVSYYDHKTHLLARPTMLINKLTDDAHDNPVLNIDANGTIWIFSSSHGTGRPSLIHRSVKPYDISKFERVWVGNFSYPQPWYLPERGFLFMHTHYTQGRSIYMTTSTDGVAWTPRRLLARIDMGHYQVTRSFGGKKVGSAFNYHPRPHGLNWRTNLYYMETADFGTTWKNVRGEVLEVPLTKPDNAALVCDYQKQKRNVYLKQLTFDADGHPIVLYITSKGYESGPKNDPRTWTTARWTGRQWDIQGSITSDNNYDTGSLYVEDDGTWRIIGPTETGPQPYNPGGEVALWVSTDKGHTWKKTCQMTRDSKYNHTYVRRPVHAHPDFYGFWADGHARKPSDSRLYFCTKAGKVFRMPVKFDGDFARPQPVNP